MPKYFKTFAVDKQMHILTCGCISLIVSLYTSPAHGWDALLFGIIAAMLAGLGKEILDWASKVWPILRKLPLLNGTGFNWGDVQADLIGAFLGVVPTAAITALYFALK